MKVGPSTEVVITGNGLVIIYATNMTPVMIQRGEESLVVFEEIVKKGREEYEARRLEAASRYGVLT